MVVGFSSFVERFGSAMSAAGMARAPANVLAALMISDSGRMTAAELGHTLGMSAGSVSGAVNYLVQVGVVRRERERGSRKDSYVVDDDTWHAAMIRTDQRYAPIIAAVKSGLDEINPGSPAHLRLLLTKEFLEFVNAEMIALTRRWEDHRQQLIARHT